MNKPAKKPFWKPSIPPLSQWSLRSKTLVIFLLLIGIPLGLQGALTYYDFSVSTERRATDYSAQLVGQMNQNLDLTLKEMRRITLMPVYDPSVLAILKKYSGPELGYQRPSVDELEKMLLYMASVTYDRPEIRGVQIFAGNGYTFSNLDSNTIRSFTNLALESWHEQVQKADGAWVLIPTHRPSYYFEREPQDYFAVARLIREPNTNRPLGVVKIDLKLDVFRQIVSNVKFEDMGSLLVVNGQNELFFKENGEGQPLGQYEELLGAADMPNASTSRRMVLGGYSYLVISDYSAYSDIKMVSFVPIRSLMKETNELRNMTLLIGIICLTLAGALATYSSYRLNRPLAALKNKMRLVEQGDFKQRVQVETEDEIGQLSRNFNRMVERIDRLVEEVYVIGLREKEAELAALQSQINPHFIYNTLESINMLAIRRESELVSDMVTALGRLLRYTVGHDRRTVRLGDELETALAYVKIQQLRYGERLRILFDVEPDLLHQTVPKLLLQPMIENAIYHGIGDSEQGGTIWINAVSFEDVLLLTVRDDGRGMPEAEMEKLRDSVAFSSLSAAQEREGHGVALRNIHQRLALMYGDTFEFHVDGSPGAGTAFTIAIPLQKEGGNTL
ncbi:MAG: integral rane sensor signal transduction histidine kinase [Paenibacillaceae bacterium]|jgi:two-component system sensor histidine kinase YesM|nr:integral rane sensor signal transduction histidine kinase [Paenibacillaceae bacterium]